MILALLAVAASQPVTPVRATMPAPIREWLSGSWQGEGTFERAGKPIQSQLDVISENDDESLALHERDDPPNRTTFSALMSIDSRTGGLVLLYVSNFAGGARLFRSPGLESGKLVFTIDPALQASFAAERFTFERPESGGFSLCYDASHDDGRTWRRGDCQTFRKRLS
ncbi:MAG: hypothetical protein ABIS14_03800 [Sphingomonas sp.]